MGNSAHVWTVGILGMVRMMIRLASLTGWAAVVDGDIVRVFVLATDAGLTAVIAILAVSACLTAKLTIKDTRIVEVVSSVLSLS